MTNRMERVQADPHSTKAKVRVTRSRTEPETTPFLKWAGGKQWLTPRLKAILSPGRRRYIEPFLGGASIFFAIRPKNAWLSDTNQELIATYLAIRRDARSVINHLKRFSYTARCYYQVRNSYPDRICQRAARFVYLNRTCWNGLYRVNRKGGFNVPIGSFANKPDFVVRQRLLWAQKALRKARIQCIDFEIACRRARKNDVVYLDPPYTTAHKNNGFLRYNERVFSWEDQKRLAIVARKLKTRGCKVIVSNADHPSVIALYRGFFITRVDRASRVAADKSKRRTVTELLITSFKALP